MDDFDIPFNENFHPVTFPFNRFFLDTQVYVLLATHETIQNPPLFPQMCHYTSSVLTCHRSPYCPDE